MSSNTYLSNSLMNLFEETISIKCPFCSKEFSSEKSLNGHLRIHTSKNPHHIPKCCNIFTRKEITAKYADEYHSKLVQCLFCGKLIEPQNKFCNNSCSAKYNNKLRHDSGWSMSEDSRNKISDHNRKRKKSTCMELYSGEYCKILIKTCQHCGSNFATRNSKKYCKNCSNLYSDNMRAQYAFTFNVYNYPELFDLSLINTHGWYSSGGKSKKWNLDGVSRDHKVSVNEAILNSYDPFYIRHPLNCELMLQKDNDKKKSKSSISYEYLKQIVDDYENSHNING